MQDGGRFIRLMSVYWASPLQEGRGISPAGSALPVLILDPVAPGAPPTPYLDADSLAPITIGCACFLFHRVVFRVCGSVCRANRI